MKDFKPQINIKVLVDNVSQNACIRDIVREKFSFFMLRVKKDDAVSFQFVVQF